MRHRRYQSSSPSRFIEASFHGFRLVLNRQWSTGYYVYALYEVLTRRCWVGKEPIIPLLIMLSSLILTCQISAQVRLMFTVPLNFQVTANASSTAAGAHLLPTVFSNAIGGLISRLVLREQAVTRY